jgi:hypothetical protein
VTFAKWYPERVPPPPQELLHARPKGWLKGHSVGDSVTCWKHGRETTIKSFAAGITYLACGCFVVGSGGVP